MTKSQAKKRSIRKFKNWRKRNHVYYCIRCGKSLRDITHHHYCNKCHSEVKKERKKKKETYSFERMFIAEQGLDPDDFEA